MNITFVNPGFEKMIESIMMFQTEGESPYWSDSLFHFFPKLNQDVFQTLDYNAKKQYILNEMKEIYQEQESLINEKVVKYSRHWRRYRPQIEEALSDAFQVDTHQLLNDLRAEISLNPVSPRFLKDQYFQVFYLNSERGALGISLHEMIHFLWFHVWNQIFHDNYDEYERPTLKWILSEMVVECIMRDERLSSINPYFPRENGGCVYDYFQDMRLGDKMALDVIEEYYQCGNIRKFMQDSYAYCQKQEEEIRVHISKAEEQF